MTATASTNYWQRTLYSLTGVSGSRPRGEQPSPAKIYPHARQVALGRPRLSIGGVARALAGAKEGNRSRLGVDELSTLLHYSYGYCRAEPWKDGVRLHRVVPSARGCYPTELYVWCGDAVGANAGLHYYDPVHHRLIVLRPGVGNDAISDALAANVGDAHFVFLVTTVFWKIAYRYSAYAYRLCTQEAGILMGNLLLIAGAFGLRGHVHYQFVDAILHRWLGLRSEDETLLGVVPVYPEASKVRASIHRPGDTAAVPPVIRTDVRPPASVRTACDPKTCAAFLDLEMRSRIRSRAQVAAPPGTVVPTFPSGPPVGSSRALELPAFDLAEALRFRSSGGLYFNPARESISNHAFWLFCRYAAAPHVSDVVSSGRLLVCQATWKTDPPATVKTDPLVQGGVSR